MSAVHGSWEEEEEEEDNPDKVPESETPGSSSSAKANSETLIESYSTTNGVKRRGVGTNDGSRI